MLAGRSEARLRALVARAGDEDELPTRAFGLDDTERLERELRDVSAVLHCAGPFVDTSAPMVRACLATGTHYLDITGEVDVFEAVFAEDAPARAAGVVLLPGVGFDVVPSDCLAALLAARLPGAEPPAALELAFAGGGGMTRGTARTLVRSLPRGVLVRRGGRLERQPWGALRRRVDFADRAREVMAIPWGDVVTAAYSTRARDITVYTAMGPLAGRLLGLASVAARRPAAAAVLDRIASRARGPSARARERTRVELWGRAQASGGAVVEGWLTVPNGYTLTARTAVDAAMRVLEGQVEPGAHTPSQAFGASYVLGFEGVRARLPEAP